MAEPGLINGKTRGQIEAQLGRISNLVDNANRTAVERARARGADVPWDEIRHNQNRWIRATSAYGRMTKDDKLIDKFKDYSPEDKFFTSAEEMKRIDRHFGLSKRSVESLSALRNNVVDYFDTNYRQSNERWNKMPWMQSITAVIDEHIRRKGGQV